MGWKLLLPSFPPTEVEGAEERLGMGQADKEFDTIKSFTWTFGGTGSVKIGQVQDVTLDKTPKIQLDIGECTGVLRSDNLAKGNVVVNKGSGVQLRCFDPETGGLVEGEDAVKIFTSEATLTDI